MTIAKIVDHYVKQVKYAREALIALCVIGIIVIAGISYRWYAHSRNEQAHQALAQAIELFNRSNEQQSVQLWQEIDQALDQGYAHYSGTALGPYFLVFKSESALRQGHALEARELLKKALGALSSGMPLYGEYTVKLARMNIDSGDQNLVQEGLKALQALAENVKHRDHAMAAYYQGLYFFELGDVESAQKAWSVLMRDRQSRDTLWAEMAQAKLDYLA